MRDLKNEYRKVLITADYHLGHANILNICNRPFKGIKEHDEQIIDRSNSMATEEDLIINLGDVAFKNSAYHVANNLEKLNCKKMMVFIGNHDKAFCDAVKRGMLNKMLDSGKLEIVGGMSAVNDHTIATSKMVEIEGQKVWLSHYAYRTWPNAFRGAWHLFGHSHSNLSSFYKSFDVGVDTNNYYPYDWEEIKIKMSQIQEGFSEK